MLHLIKIKYMIYSSTRNILYSNLFKKNYIYYQFSKNNQVNIYTENYFIVVGMMFIKVIMLNLSFYREKIEIIEILILEILIIIDLDIREIFKEYGNSNLAIVYIDENNLKINKFFKQILWAKILTKVYN